MSGEAFSTVVHQTAPGEGAVHGIDAEEIAQGPPFREAFLRLARFVENLREMAVAERGDSSQECGATTLQPMEMVVCAQRCKVRLPFSAPRMRAPRRLVGRDAKMDFR